MKEKFIAFLISFISATFFVIGAGNYNENQVVMFICFFIGYAIMDGYALYKHYHSDIFYK